jgi:cytoskeletal protein CcmA (bactofilin family)
MRRLISGLLVVLFGISTVIAVERLQADQCVIAAGEVVTGNVFVLCRDLVVEGQVNGNLFGIAYTSQIRGQVDKNVYLAGGKLEVDGRVGSDLHFGGIVLEVQPNAHIDGDLFFATLSTTQRATLPSGLIGIGYQLVIPAGSEIGQGVEFWGSTLQIDGRIVGNVDVSVGDSQAEDVASQLETLLIPLQFNLELINPGLILSENAEIDGGLIYRSQSPGRIDGQVSGELTYIAITSDPTLIELVEEDDPLSAFQIYLDQVIREVTTLGLLGLIGLLLVPQQIQRLIRTLRYQPLASLGVGVPTFILSFPVWVIVFFLSLLLILILSVLRLDGVIIASGMILGLVNIGGTSLFYFVAIFISRMIVAIALGRTIVRWFTLGTSARSWFVSLVVGAAIFGVLVSLPVIGWVFNALALFLGVGAIISVIQLELLRFREQSTSNLSPRTYYAAELPPSLPPPPALSQQPRAPGMDNLPDGFNFDFWRDNDPRS